MTSYSRDQLEATIKNGGSVFLGGRHIDRIEDLPSDTAMASGNSQQLRDTLRHLTIRRDALDKEITDAEAQLGAAEEAEAAAQEAEEARAKEAEPKRKRRTKKAEEEGEEKPEETQAAE